MSQKQDPSKPASNEEKFKPQNVAAEGTGQSVNSGRLDRNMQQGTARGSEPSTRGAGMERR
jgi:hypothetical protein